MGRVDGKSSFILLYSYSDAVQALPPAEAGLFIQAVFRFVVDGKGPKAPLPPLAGMVYSIVTSQIAIDSEKYQKKCEQNAENIHNRWGKNTPDTPNTTDTPDTVVPMNDGMNEGLNEGNKSGKPDGSFAQEVISYLNRATGKNFRASTAATVRVISARQREGYTLADFQAVIDGRAAKWKNNPKMAEYLRPETVFGGKFESYLQEARSTPTEQAQPATYFNPDLIDLEGVSWTD